MKRVRPKADETIAEEATTGAVERPERTPRRPSLIRECWADLRGRSRPVAEPAWEEEPQSRIETGGIGIDEVGFRRMETRYTRASSAADQG